MSILTTVNQANPQNFFFAASGQGAATTLQSPVAVIPDGAGDTQLVAQATGTGRSVIEAVGSATGDGIVVVSGQGTAYRVIATSVAGNSNLQIGLDSPAQAAMTYTPSSGTVTLGDGSAGGTVLATNALVVKDPAGGALNGVVIEPTGATGGLISMSCATGGTLLIGSSIAQPATLTIADAGANRGVVAVGGNNGTDILLTGGDNLGTFANIRANLANQGTMTLGSSSANPVCMYLTDGVGAGTGSVDITNGTAASGTLKLQGGDGAGFCHIYPNFPSAGIQIGSSSATTNAIEVADTGITMNTPVYFSAPSFANYTPTILAPTGSVYTGVFNIGLGGLPTGYWMILGKTTNNPSGADRTSMFSTIVYMVGGLIKAGGTAAYPTYWTTIPNAADDSQLTVTLSSPTTTNYSIVAMPINYA